MRQLDFTVYQQNCYCTMYSMCTHVWGGGLEGGGFETKGWIHPILHFGQLQEHHRGNLNPAWQWIMSLVVITEDNPLTKGLERQMPPAITWIISVPSWFKSALQQFWFHSTFLIFWLHYTFIRNFQIFWLYILNF